MGSHNLGETQSTGKPVNVIDYTNQTFCGGEGGDWKGGEGGQIILVFINVKDIFFPKH